MGVKFVKGKVAKIEESDNDDLLLFYEDIENGGRLSKAVHDLAVLAVGLLPYNSLAGVFKDSELTLDPVGWVKSPNEDKDPLKTSIDGVFAAGTAVGPKDIPDSIVEGSAAAVCVAAYLSNAVGKTLVEVKQ